MQNILTAKHPRGFQIKHLYWLVIYFLVRLSVNFVDTL